MTTTYLALIIYATVALIVALMFFLVRDLNSYRKVKKAGEVDQEKKPIDMASLLPSLEAAAEKDVSWLGKLVSESGSDFTTETVLLLACIIGLAIGGSCYLWLDDELAGIAGGVFGVLGVGIFLFYQRFRRYRSIREQLPDVMELLARAVRAGESLDQAIALAGSSTLQPLASEFRYCSNQIKMGLSLESAVRGLVGRLPLVETRILAMTLTVQRRRGGNLPSTLERLARVFRDRNNFYRQFQAATALGRGSVILITLVALGLDMFVFLGQSDFTRSLLTTGPGRIMLVLSLVLQVLGIAWVLYLFRSQY
jgi:tight adherence protein B